MNFLFLHNNFPGQFHNLCVALARNPAHKVVFLSCYRRGDVQVPGVTWRQVLPADSGKTLPKGHSQPPALLMAEIFADAMLKLKKEGFIPDVVYSHAGFAPGLHAPDVFLDASCAAYLEWMYTDGADIGYSGGRKNVSFSGLIQQRHRNMCVCSALESSIVGICPTYWQREQHPPRYYDKIHVIHDGVDTHFFSPDAKDVFAPEGVDLKDAELVTFATRGLEPYRGFHTFYRSLPAVLEARPKAQVLIMAADRTVYGGKPKNGKTWREVLCDEVKLDQSRVHFLPFQPYDKYRSLLRSSHVHVYLTVPFVLSWSLLEAMSCGCLIVGSDTEPVREVMQHEHNGLLTQFDDHRLLARRIIEGLERQSQLTHIRHQARQTVLQRYALAKLLPRQVSLLERLPLLGNATLQRC